MQFQADVCGCKVSRAKVMETTALGVAYLAGLRVGVWNSIDEIKGIWVSDKEYTPTMDIEKKNAYVKKWHKAVLMCQGWEKKE